MSEPDDDLECLLLDALPRAARAGGLPLIQYLVIKQQYVLTRKVLDLVAEGYFELEDLEHALLKGSVRKTECDEFKDSLGNKKYIIVGPDRCGYEFYTVGKIQRLADSQIYLVITAHYAGTNYD